MADRSSAISRKAGLHHEQWLLRKTNTPNVPPCSFSPPALTAEHMMWYGIPLWSAEASYSNCVPSQLLVHTSLLTGRAAWEAQKPLRCVSTVQQRLKHPCVINTLLITNTKPAAHKPLWRKLTLFQPWKEYTSK